MVMELTPEMDSDPVLAAMRTAPIVEATPEEMAAFDEGLADIRAGRTISAAHIRRQIDARSDQ